MLRVSVVTALMVSTAAACADVVTLFPTKDATMIQENDQIANGRGLGVFCGNIGIGAGYARRGLFQFDLSSIPAGATITRVELALTLTRTVNGNQSCSLFKVLTAWNEGPSHQGNINGQGSFAQSGDVTWSHTNFATQFWANPGGDMAPAASAMTTVGSALSTYTWTSAGLVADVQSWLSAPATNFGWLLKGNEATATTSKRFASRETGGSQRPRVLIEYTPIPAPASAALLGLAGLMTARRRR